MAREKEFKTLDEQADIQIYDRASYEDFKWLFTLDRKLPVHLFEEITKIETQIKTAISYNFNLFITSSKVT